MDKFTVACIIVQIARRRDGMLESRAGSRCLETSL